MTRFFALCAIVGAFIAMPGAALAGVVAKVNISQQKLFVTVNGKPVHAWTVSTGLGRARTPTGSFRPTRMHRHYFSRKYNNAPMPHSIYFYKGYAIHGTDQIRHLGRPASKGCVRLHPDHAAKLFALVRRHGPANTRIVVTR